MRIAIDTGGTFTDCVFLEDGRLRILKIFSTPANPAEAILKAVRKITAQAAGLELRHGTTVGTNTLLERNGARVAFVTTAGFEDTIAIGRQCRPNLYDWFVVPPPPLAPEGLRFGVDERTLPDGSVLKAADPKALKRLAAAVREAGAESVAVSLLFSFANSQNELAAGEALACLGVPVSLSHRILPEFREYERGSTVLVNAYLAPRMSRYVEQLAASFPGSQVSVMQSSGGIVAADVAAREPVRTILSGPAGGVVGAHAVARQAGFERIITFDMGGTSTDVALVDGPLATTNESVVAGLPVGVPMLDIHTVGAGGGSLAHFDSGGALRVGPQSAGADPGPICYGKGTRPTVTDANLLLGRLDPQAFLGGELTLDAARAKQYCSKARGGLKSVDEFAAGIMRLAEATMEKAIRVISVERGRDPRDYTLVSFGGAGGLHACSLARALRIPRVLVPCFPGALSALGILISDVVKDYSRTVMLPPDSPQLELHFRELETSGQADLKQEGLRGMVQRSLDMRYAGQGFELNVDAGIGFLKRFHAAHRQRYGYADPARPVEVVNVRVRLVSQTQPVKFSKQRLKRGNARQAIARRGRVVFDGRAHQSPIYQRDSLKPGDAFAGPAVLVEYSATTVIPPGCRANVDAHGNVVIEL